ncbi:MAG: hypothetical protein ACE5HB_08525 [Terriglobia bacterium]
MKNRATKRRLWRQAWRGVERGLLADQLGWRYEQGKKWTSIAAGLGGVIGAAGMYLLLRFL